MLILFARILQILIEKRYEQHIRKRGTKHFSCVSLSFVSAIKFEAAPIHFSRDVFIPIAVVVA